MKNLTNLTTGDLITFLELCMLSKKTYLQYVYVNYKPESSRLVVHSMVDVV